MLLASIALFLSAQDPRIDFKQAWSGVRSSIEQRYYARTEQATRMKSLLDKYQPKAQAARTPAEFEVEVNRMIDEFGDSHFGFFTKGNQGFYMMDSLIKRGGGAEMPHVGAWFKPEGKGFAIQMLLEEGPAASAGLRKGDVVTEIDGQPFTPVDSLSQKVEKKAKLTFLRNGREMTAEVEVKQDNGTQFFLKPTRASQRIIDHGGKKYGYIHLWTMSNEDQKNALANAVYGRMKDTDGFILDIRDGFGGRPEGFGDPFFRPDVKLSWETPSFSQSQLFGYQRPLVILINKGSRSAKEVFAYIMKESKRAILVGERTGGNVLGTSPSPVGDWAYLEIPMVDVKTNGVRLEKVGVAPDVPVAREYDENGKDLHIEEALRVLEKQTAARKAA